MLFAIDKLLSVLSCFILHSTTYLKLQTVLSSIEGSPAARAGIHSGDELVEIDGKAPKILFFFSQDASCFLSGLIYFKGNSNLFLHLTECKFLNLGNCLYFLSCLLLPELFGLFITKFFSISVDNKPCIREQRLMHAINLHFLRSII